MTPADGGAAGVTLYREIDWSAPIEAVHSDGRVRAVRVLQLNAGAFDGNDHWLATEDGKRFDQSGGSINCLWARRDGVLPSYAYWMIRNVRVRP